MVHQIILPRFYIPRSTKIHPILLTDMLDLLIRTRQADNIGMELLKVCSEYVWCVTEGIASDENRLENLLAFIRFVDFIDYPSHFVQFIRTNIGAMRESKINLAGFQKSATTAK